MRSICLLMTLACVLPAALTAQNRNAGATPPRGEPRPTASPAPIEVRTWVSRTAVWLGDRVTYVVEFHAAPEVEILTGDLDPDRLSVEGLEIVDVATERDASVPGRVTHRMRYGLVTYQVDAPALTIAAIPVRYSLRRPGQRPEDAVTAGEVLVPPLAVALRSTLPSSGAAIAIRDARPVQPLPRVVRLAQPVGAGLLILSVVPVALWGAGLVRRARQSRSRRRTRRPLKQSRAAFEEIKALDVTSKADRRDAYARLDTWVREQVEQATGIAAAALTPSEIPSAVPHPPRSVHLEDLQRLLIECERAKYAPDPPPADRWPDALNDAEQLLSARAR